MFIEGNRVKFKKKSVKKSGIPLKLVREKKEWNQKGNKLTKRKESQNESQLGC